MNARIQRWNLLLRSLLSFGALVWFWRAGQPGLGCGLALLIFFFYGLVMGLMFASLHHINRDSQPSALQLLRAWVLELISVERIFAWQQPFAEQAVPDYLPEQCQQRGVLLLHGFTCNRGLWNGWMRRLRSAGHPFIALTMEPAFGSIDAYCDQIGAAVAKLQQLGGQAPVIVGHSMGGLALRAWLRREHLQAIQPDLHRCITIGTPHFGTLMANFSLARNARQMRCGSRWLAELAQQESLNGAGFDCYYSACDQIVCPSSTAMLPGARVIELPAIGHLSMLFHPPLFADLLGLLQDHRRTGPVGGSKGDSAPS